MVHRIGGLATASICDPRPSAHQHRNVVAEYQDEARKDRHACRHSRANPSMLSGDGHVAYKRACQTAKLE